MRKINPIYHSSILDLNTTNTQLKVDLNKQNKRTKNYDKIKVILASGVGAGVGLKSGMFVSDIFKKNAIKNFSNEYSQTEYCKRKFVNHLSKFLVEFLRTEEDLGKDIRIESMLVSGLKKAKEECYSGNSVYRLPLFNLIKENGLYAKSKSRDVKKLFKNLVKENPEFKTANGTIIHYQHLIDDIRRVSINEVAKCETLKELANDKYNNSEFYRNEARKKLIQAKVIVVAFTVMGALLLGKITASELKKKNERNKKASAR